MTPLISNLDHVSIAVTDLASAISDYQTLFNTTVSMRASSTDNEAWLYTGNIWLRLHQSRDTTGLNHMAFACSDWAKAQRRIKQFSLATEYETTESKNSAVQLNPDRTRGISLSMTPQEHPSQDAATKSRDVTALDHVVIKTAQPEHTGFVYGSILGLDCRMDLSNPKWDSRLIFYRCGDLIVELYHPLSSGEPSNPDTFFGLTWRVADINTTRARLIDLGVAVSELRKGRKPGTAVFTVKSHTQDVPTLFIGPSE
ncbi:MAG: VOC family protein [Halieaceae bacterium]|nr:VOC family protein [Halieaceae bacterium]